MSTPRTPRPAADRATLALRAISSALFAVMILACAVTTAQAADRGRVKVQNGTVVSDRNTILRGGRLQLVQGYVLPDSYWHFLNATLGLNAVRFGVKTGHVGRTVEQQLPSIDLAVERAAANNLYLMINNAVSSGTYDFDQLKEFWSAVAPRYKDRTHVFFEMTNEPVKGSPHWGMPAQFTDQVLSDLKQIYLIMRNGAPNTHIVMFTTANLWPDCASWAALVRKMDGVDWSNASVGFHHYNATNKFGETGLQCLRQQYPLLMTETNYWAKPVRAVLRDALSTYEKLGMSWFSLDGTSGAYYLENEIIPALHRDGYFWPPEN